MTLDEYKVNLDKLRVKFDEIGTQLDEIGEQCDEIAKQSQELLHADIENMKPIPPHSRWKPKEDERYYTILGDGEIHSWLYHAIDDDKQVIGRYSIGNVFHTEADVEFALERLKVLAEMQEWAGKWNDEFSIRCDETHGLELYFHVFHFKSYGEMRFATKEDAQNCIEAVGEDRIRKYYFMIPEDKSNA